MRGLWLFNIVSVFSAFAPAVLLGIAWTRFLKPEARSERARWRSILGAASLLAVSLLFVVCVVKFCASNCDADAGDWSCVVTWRAFARLVVRSAPVFLALALLGAKRTRILAFVSVLAMVFDVVMVDMMA